MGLRSPRFDSFRGFIFVCFDRETGPLREYLAGAAEYLDLVADQDPAGMRVIPGSNRYSIKANWKLMVENSVDGYHTPFTHRTFFDYMAGTAGDDATAARNRRGVGRSLGNGHGVMENDAVYGRPIAMWHPSFGEEAKAEMQRIKDDLVARHGLDKALRMCEKTRNLVIFPNLVVNDIMAVTVRTFHPTGSAGMDVTAWELAPAGEAGVRLRDLPEGDPQTDLVFIDDDRDRMAARVVRLKSRHAHCEYPWSRTRRFVSNVMVTAVDGDEIEATAAVAVWRFRAGESAPYVGRCDVRLRRVDGRLRLCQKRAVLDQETLSDHGALSIIL